MATDAGFWNRRSWRGPAERLPPRLVGGMLGILGAVEVAFAASAGSAYIQHPGFSAGLILLTGLAGTWYVGSRRPGLDAHIFVAAVFLATWTYLALTWWAQPASFVIASSVFAPLVAAVLLKPWPTAAWGATGFLLTIAMRVWAPSGELLDVEAFVFAYVVPSVAIAGSWYIDQQRTAASSAGSRATLESSLGQDVIDALPDALWVVGPRLKILRENRAATISFPGRNRDDLDAVLPKRVVPQVAAMASQSPDTTQWWRFHHGDRDWEVQVVPRQLDAEAIAIVGIRDITELRKAASASTEAAREARVDTLNLVTHEIRTPLTAALLKAHMLRAGVGGALTAKQYRSLNSIMSAMQRTSRSVDLLTQSARVLAGKTSAGAMTVRLDPAVQKALEEQGRPSQNDVPEDVTINTDPVALHISLSVTLQSLVDADDGPLHVWAERDGKLVHLYAQHLHADGPFRPVEVGSSPSDGEELARTVAKAAVEQHAGHFSLGRNKAGDEQWRLSWPLGGEVEDDALVDRHRVDAMGLADGENAHA